MSVSCHLKEFSWSKSEGSLVDLDDGSLTRNDWIDNKENELHLKSHWTGEFKQHTPGGFKTNPFWKEMSASNPFLDDIAQSCNKEKNNTRISILKEDPDLFFRDSNGRDSAASSGDELNIEHLFCRKPSKRSAKSRSVSDLLDIIDVRCEFSNTEPTSYILPPESEAFQNQREAYKTAWLNQRQLARSCLDLNVINQGPGWAQTQSIETHIFCKVNYEGGSVQLPDSDIAVHFPEGHVSLGEFQEVGLQAILDSPPSLNDEFSTTLTPLIELTLSNLNTTEAILLEMKIAAEIKKDPFSQVMTEIVCLCSCNKEGPFEKTPNCYIYKDTVQVKLTNLSHLMYIVVVAQTNTVNSLVSVWEYIHRKLSVGIYGPKHIHPSFTVVFALFDHNYVPEKLTVCDIKRGGKSLPPVIFQLWGKHTFVLEKPQDLSISVVSCDPDFEVKKEEQRKEIKEEKLKGGGVIHRHFPFSIICNRKIHIFVFRVQIKVPENNLASQFYITTPEPPPKLMGITNKPNRIEKRKEIKSAPLLLLPTIKYPTFQDKVLNITRYGIALKTVLRQNKIDYLLEYFKGDTIGILGEDKVKAIGQTKIKEWYVAVLRRKVGLVHCKNIKVITENQTIDVEDSEIMTSSLLEQIALPFKKMTYIYSTILSTVSENLNDWKALADALQFSDLSRYDLNALQIEKESEKVAYILKKLKEICHTHRSTRRFLYELSVALLKLDCQGLVARITQDTVIFTAAVKLGKSWRELAEKLARLTKQQIDAYETPHHGKNGEVAPEMMWKPAYDFLYTWSAHYGDSYRDMLQDLHLALDKMKNPVTKQWREITGALILVNCMEVLRASAFSMLDEE